MNNKIKTAFSLLLAGGLFSSTALASSLGCVNFYDHFGNDRVVIFEAAIKDSSHIPDALFMIDGNTAAIEVQENQNDEYVTVVESDQLELIYADFYTEVHTYQGDGYNLHLLFDRADATMNVRYVDVENIIESSVDSSLCRIL